mmetsp:Transcript_22232/g.51141  ORF Transcript_22232/g.51141 Transcript_22232/m.51141 type:complete len:222 (-) Transcript_22232:1199-1864(-)
MSTREPSALRRSSSLSSTSILPQLVTKWSPKGGKLLSSTPSNRYGWLQHLRSCITKLSSRDLLAVSAAPDDWYRASMSRLRMFLYCSLCIGASCVYTMSSVLGGSDPSTSVLTRRSKKGRSTLWSLLMTACSTCLSCRSNHESKSSDDEKTSGMRKLSSAHSSCRLFCIGVPVISSRECDENERSTCESFDSSFFMRCASSTMMYRHANFRNAFCSRVTIS